MAAEIADTFWYYVKKGALIAVGVAVLLHLISLGSPAWARSTPRAGREDTIGLWRYCTSTITPSGTKQVCGDFVDIRVSDWMHAAQSFMVLAFFGLLACVGLFALYLLVPQFQESLRILGICVVAGTVTGGMTSISIGVYAGGFEDYFINRDPNFTPDASELYWGFYLAVVSAFLTFLAPIMLLPETMLEIRNETRLQNARIKAANFVKGQRRF